MDALIRVEVPTDTPDPKIMRQKVESESYEKLRKTDRKAIHIRTLCIYAKTLLCIILKKRCIFPMDYHVALNQRYLLHFLKTNPKEVAH